MKIKDVLWVFFISMVPFIELRGAVPVGTVLGLPFYINFAVAVLGNLLPVPFILLLMPLVLDFLARFKIFKPVVDWIRSRAVKGSKKISADVTNTENSDISADNKEKQSALNKSKAVMPKGAFIGLMLFVLLPVPGTGAWCGSLIAALFGFPKLKSFIAVALGVLGCGVIMCLASYGVLGFLSFLL